MKTSITPTAANFYDETMFHEKGFELEESSFQNTIGYPNLSAFQTRPDIAISVRILSQFSRRPLRFHVNAAKRIFDYQIGTFDYNLVKPFAKKYSST